MASLLQSNSVQTKFTTDVFLLTFFCSSLRFAWSDRWLFTELCAFVFVAEELHANAKHLTVKRV